MWLQRGSRLIGRPASTSAVVSTMVVPRTVMIGSGSYISSSNSGSSSVCNRSYSNSSRASGGVEWHGTTILCVRKNGMICMMGDGQVTAGNIMIKPNVKKVRRIGPSIKQPPKTPKTEGDGKDEEELEEKGTVVGFAGSTADAFTLLERLEGKLEEYGEGQLTRSCVELAKGWRTDKYLRRLEASLLVADHTGVALEITGNGDVLESHDGVLAVGSGGHYAMAAARALQTIPELSAQQVALQSMQVAADMCIYTNSNFRTEILTITTPTDDENINKTDPTSDENSS